LSTVIISRATAVQNALDGLIASFGGNLIRPGGFCIHPRRPAQGLGQITSGCSGCLPVVKN
jgi:hypothetical protein